MGQGLLFGGTWEVHAFLEEHQSCFFQALAINSCVAHAFWFTSAVCCIAIKERTYQALIKQRNLVK